MMTGLPMKRSDAAAPGLAGGRSVLPGALALLLLVSPVAGQFSAQPVILEIRTANSASTTTFAVWNEGESALQLRIYAEDFDQHAGGGHAFMEPGTHPRSCADRLRFYPDNLLLEPRAAGDVRVLMEPGDSTCWSIVFVQSMARSRSGIQISQRIGIKVYGFSDRLVPEGEIRSVMVESDTAEGGLLAVIDFLNSGDAPLRAEGDIEIRTEEGEIVAVVPVAPFSVLPRRVRRTRIGLELALPPGRYLAIPVLDFGGDYLAGGQAVFDVGQ
ncbi:MAG: hypothetical protein KY466_09990 [Gemmatimonadetes bacterium]|nr:hypothetical protein [Gemmatimonadota bacterium]